MSTASKLHLVSLAMTVEMEHVQAGIVSFSDW